MSKVVVIVGTVRQGRVGRRIADWYMEQAKQYAPEGMELELFDLAEQKLELFDEPIPPMAHKYSEVQQNLAAKIGAADGFVFITGEYNHSIPGSLKNFLDYLYAEWNHKAAAYVGYGVSGGARSIEHLIQVMTELRVASVRDGVFIRSMGPAFDEDGNPKPEFVLGDVQAQLRELGWWANTLKVARKKVEQAV